MIDRLDVRLGAIAVLIALSAAPLAAAPGSAPVARASLRAQSLAVPGSARLRQQTTPTAAPAPEPRAFWRSRRGVAVAVMMIAVTGYVLYSKSHDRVKSPTS